MLTLSIDHYIKVSYSYTIYTFIPIIAKICNLQKQICNHFYKTLILGTNSELTLVNKI